MALFRPFVMNLAEQMGWTIQQINKFSYYEQKILDVYRWHYRQADIWMKKRSRGILCDGEKNRRIIYE